MCGISGLWNLDGSSTSAEEFLPFINALNHRGPNGCGVFKDLEEPLYLGHRRLSILDLSEKGVQPMSFINERYWITFNGEIYNFLELRKELQDLGYVFHSDTDTEVILASYIEWGMDCQLKFNGMWAFAIWDAREKSLFLSRDRFGVKPLYYHFSQGHKLAFASEVKAFTHLANFDVHFNEQLISNVLYDVNCIESTEFSLIRSIHRLQGGHSAFYKKGGTFIVRKWWDTLDHLTEIPKSWEEQVETFRELFLNACHLRLRSDVPTATALSGGLDSSSVLVGIAYMGRRGAERMSPEWRQAFSAQFPNTSQDESLFAQQMVAHVQAIPFHCPIQADLVVQHIDQALYDLEEIFDLPIGPWLLYRQMSKQGTVISIDGHGPDELLGGYLHHVESAIAESLMPRINPWKAREFHRVLQGLYPEGSPFKKTSFPSLLKKSMQETLKSIPLAYRFIRTCFRRLGLAKGLQKNWLQIAPEFRSYSSDHPRFKKWGLFEQTLYLDFHQRTLPTILRNFDRCSMAHGVEIRAPFLDWRLVCYAFSLPREAKIGNGFTKRILREAMKGFLPESIRTRTAKVGFASPINEWLKKDLKPFMLDRLCDRSFQTSNIWDGPQILQFVENAYKNNDMAAVRSAWEFVQADRLMQLFKSPILK